MEIKTRALSALSALVFGASAFAAQTNPQAVTDLLNRIGGQGTAGRFVTVLDESLAASDGSETFVLTSSDGKPCIKGSTLSALTTGIGWYLNHTANINLTWNNLTTDLTSVELPLPTEETHSSAAQYRYYLNYCTFSYSMSTWTWDRWQKEIDWMALHGINMPLQIIGLEEVWRKLLMEDYNYTAAEANDFVGGPSFMAWFGMNNLQGWGGPNPDWWYQRQAELGKKMIARMHELGIEPVLPGFAGMVPSNFTSKTGIAASGQGNWCGFVRPYILDATGSSFAAVAANYYKRLKEVLGESQYYSIDPFHEGGAAPANVDLAYQNLYKAMDDAKSGSQFVIQSWQWSGAQWKSLNNIPIGKLIVLDLYSDGNPNWGAYRGHDTVYCTIFNFGGRTGFFGRFNRVIDGYFDARNTSPVKGIGAAPEAIEQTPVMYDLLFELPWHATKPDAAGWMEQYARRRYHADSPEAKAAWELLRTSALDCKTSLQGPHEAIVCSRPSLTVNKVSTWGSAEIFYDQTKMYEAAYALLDANLSGENYSYDLADITRQALTDYSKSLLAAIKEANNAGDTELFNKRRDAFLQLILDIDELLCTNKDLMLGHWTERARAIASEMAGTSESDADWLEHKNARTLITTWGPQNAAESGGLHDYSYREWGGMLKDFYYQRWKIWFDNGMAAPSGGWFQWERNWAFNNTTRYATTPTGNTRDVARKVLNKYLTPFVSNVAGISPYYVARMMTVDRTGKLFDDAARGIDYAPDFAQGDVAEIAIDYNQNSVFAGNEVSAGATIAISADAPIGERKARITLTDGTVLYYTVRIIEEITEARTVSVASADATQGTVSIDGTDALSVTNTERVVLRAKPMATFDFSHWEDANGNNVGSDNPMTYYGKEPASFIAHFIVNKWGVPKYNGTNQDHIDMKNYKQYISTLSEHQGDEVVALYTATECPEEHFVQIPTRIKAAAGSEFTFSYTQPGDGMKYLFLSAYVDLNADGTFDPATDLLGTIGTRNAQDTRVGAGTFTTLLPYDALKGTTHIRLRFDSAWGSAYDDRIKAFPADAATNRIIYELILEVTDAANFVTKVTVKSSDTTLGTVRSENEATNLYAPGEDVQLTAFPNVGAHVKRWIDSHGRELPAEWISEDGLSVNFKAFDNIGITCEFEAAPVAVDGWQFNCATMEDGSKSLTSAIAEGSSVLDLSELDVTNIAPEVFANSNLTEITLPANTLMGEGEKIFSTTINGDGTQNKLTQVSPTIKGTDSWVMTIQGETGSSSFNEYGSAIYGNGDNCLADNYSNGWSQFYLRKDGTLCIKWDSGSDVKFSNVNLNGSFKIRAEFDGDKTLVVTATNAQGNSQTMELKNTSVMRDISQFAVAIPSGMNLTYSFAKLSSPQNLPALFEGCHSLVNVHIPSSNADYRERDGVIYKKTGSRVVLYPEGRLHRAFFLKSGSNYVGANPVMNGGSIADADVVNGTRSLGALWRIDGNRLTHVNSGLSLSSDATGASATAGTFGHSLSYSTLKPQLQLSAAGSHTYDFESVEALAVEYNGVATVTFPVAVTVPAGVKAAYISAINVQHGVQYTELQEGDIVPAGQALLLKELSGTVTFPVVTDDVAAVNALGNLLVGTNVEIADGGDCYVLSGNNFVRRSSGSIPANSAYIPAASVPAEIGNTFSYDYAGGQAAIINGIDTPAACEDKAFDLLGRRTKASRPGIYIINGAKVRK